MENFYGLHIYFLNIKFKIKLLDIIIIIYSLFFNCFSF